MEKSTQISAIIKYQKKALKSICPSVIVYRKHKDCYPEVFLEECKYVAKEKNTSKFITNDRNFF